MDLQGVAFALSGQKRLAKAIRLNAAVMENAKLLGLSVIVDFWLEWYESYIVGAMKELGEELTKKYEEEGIAMGFEKAVQYGLYFDQD